MKDEIIQKTAAFIAESILRDPGRAIAADEALLSTGLIDSFNVVNLAVFVEDTFNVRLENYELNRETFDSLEALADMIVARAA